MATENKNNEVPAYDGLNGIKVTNIQVYPVREPKGKLRAFARIMLNDCIQLTALRLYDGASGLFVAYPSDSTAKGDDYRQVFYPVTRELRDLIESTIINEYNYALEN